MNLFINSPACYTGRYGIVDDIYRMCLTISKNINVQKYTDKLECIGITPIIAPQNEIVTDSKWKEIKKISLTSRIAIISLQIDYSKFIDADIQNKKNLILKNILDSLHVVKKKICDFDYDGIVSDIHMVLHQRTVDPGGIVYTYLNTKLNPEGIT